MIRFKGNMCLEAIIRCEGQGKSFWTIHFRWGLRVWSILDAGFLVSFRCRARRFEMFAWHPRFKVGVSRKLWMKLKTRCETTRCLMRRFFMCNKSLGLEIKSPSLHDRSQSEMWHGSLGMETMTSWRIHLKCANILQLLFDPIGIYLWHTLAAELHPLGDKRVYDSTSCDPVNSRSVKGHEVIFWCRWLLKLFQKVASQYDR